MAAIRNLVVAVLHRHALPNRACRLTPLRLAPGPGRSSARADVSFAPSRCARGLSEGFEINRAPSPTQFDPQVRIRSVDVVALPNRLALDAATAARTHRQIRQARRAFPLRLRHRS